MKVFRLHVNQPVTLVRKVIDQFRDLGEISLEGDLSRVSFEGFQGLRNEPSNVLMRNTTDPKAGFVRIPLVAENVDVLKKVVLPHIGLRSNVWHIQVQQAGRLVFGSYDAFSTDSVWIAAEVSEEALRLLKDEHVISSYTLTDG